MASWSMAYHVVARHGYAIERLKLDMVAEPSRDGLVDFLAYDAANFVWAFLLASGNMTSAADRSLRDELEAAIVGFSVGPGHVLGVADTTVLFIGGVQGRIGSREEVREAARLNSELSPRALLVLAAQALARAIDVDEIIAVGEDEHISRAYAEAQMSFDYAQFWTKVGGVRVGRHYRLPMESPHKPLALVAASHRSRARRRREIKHAIRDALDLRFRQLIEPRSRVSCVAETT